MKNEALYNKTVDILVQAYFNDTLQHGNCFACAVGNIVAANCGYEYKPSDIYQWVMDNGVAWKHTNELHDTATFYLGFNKHKSIPELVQKQIVLTGYSLNELAIIEEAFESTCPAIFKNHLSSETIDRHMFNGLMAVVDVLDKIHGNNDVVITKTSKNKFEKQPA